MFEIAAGLVCLAGLCVEDAEVAPAVGIFLVDAKCGLLLRDRGGESSQCGTDYAWENHFESIG